MQVGFSSWIVIRQSCIKYHKRHRLPLGVYVIKNSLFLDDSISVDKVSGECRLVDLLLVYCGGVVLCVSFCRSFVNFIGCGCRSSPLSGEYGWSLIRLTYLGGCGSK